jgi:bacteriocin-like protein
LVRARSKPSLVPQTDSGTAGVGRFLEKLQNCAREIRGARFTCRHEKNGSAAAAVQTERSEKKEMEMNETRAIQIQKHELQELNEHELKSVSGGIALLSPTVQKVRADSRWLDSFESFRTPRVA